MGIVGEASYQVMLTIRGSLITPFILGSTSAGLNILIRLRIYDYGLGTMTTTSH